MLCKVTHCAGHIFANTRPHQLRWGDREVGTAISCIHIFTVTSTHAVHNGKLDGMINSTILTSSESPARVFKMCLFC